MSQNPMVSEAQDEESLVRPIYECLTPKMRESYDALTDDLRNLSLIELEDRITVTPTMRQVKIRFWDAYNKTIAQDKKAIEIASMVHGVCSREYFYAWIVGREEIYAWLFHPPTDFDTATVEALDFGIDRLRNEILTAPLYTGEGAFDTENAKVILSAVKFLDARVKGSPLQRIEQKSLHLHKNADGPRSVTREQLDQELADIRARLAGQATPLQISAPDDPE